MKKSLFTLLLGLSVLFANAQVYSSSDSKDYDNGFHMGIGAGIGLPYGVFGVKVGGFASLVHGGIGLGIIPIMWEGAYSVSGGIQAPKGFSNFYPKFTYAVSNASAVILLYDQTNMEALYSAKYPGHIFLIGAEYRSPSIPVSLDFNIGYLTSFAGDDKFLNEYDAAQDVWEAKGYSFTEKIKAPSGIKISMGLMLYF